MEVIRIALDSITVSPEVQPRHLGLDESHVDDMTEYLDRHPDRDLPAVRVFSSSAGYVLSRGFHRHAAYSASSRSDIPCEVVEGDLTAATIDAAADQDNSLKRTNADKRRAAANVLRVSPKWSNRRVADHVGVTDKTVADVRAEMESGAEIPHLNSREGMNGRTQPAKKPARDPSGAEFPHLSGTPDEFVTPSFEIPDADDESRAEIPNADAPADPDAWFKSKDSFADEVVAAIRSLKKVAPAVSAVFESPHADLVQAVAAQHKLRWSPDGEEMELANRLGVKVMLRTWSCLEVDALYRFLCELNAWLRKPDVLDRAAAWEGDE